MVIILLLKRHWGSWDRESVASQMNQPKTEAKMKNQKKNTRVHVHFFIYPLHLHKQNDNDIICWHHNSLLLLGGKSLHSCTVESHQLIYASANVPNLFPFTNHAWTTMWIPYPNFYTCDIYIYIKHELHRGIYYWTNMTATLHMSVAQPTY